MKKIAIIIGATLVAMFLNVGATVLYMVVYGYVINPGQPPEHYPAHAQVAGPYASIIAGIPIFFVLGYVVRRILNWAPGPVFFWALYAAVDLSVLTAVGGWSALLAVQATVSMTAKLGAAILGSRVAAGKDAV